MKKTKAMLVLIYLVQAASAQSISIAPNTGLNFCAFGYPLSNNEPNSILTYPYSNNLNANLGVDIIYAPKNKRHILSFTSTPLGVSFKGTVNNRESNRVGTIFKHSSYARQLTVGYQLFFTKTISNARSLHKIDAFYGAGIGIGFNRSEQFYKTNNIPIAFGGSNSGDSIFYAFEYTKNRIGLGYFLMPEIGFTYHNKDDKPVVNASFYYYLGLKAQTSYDLTLQYGKLFSNYFEEEKPILATKGGLFGFKLSFPFRVLSLNKVPKKNINEVK